MNNLEREAPGEGEGPAEPLWTGIRLGGSLALPSLKPILKSLFVFGMLRHGGRRGCR